MRTALQVALARQSVGLARSYLECAHRALEAAQEALPLSAHSNGRSVEVGISGAQMEAALLVGNLDALLASLKVAEGSR